MPNLFFLSRVRENKKSIGARLIDRYHFSVEEFPRALKSPTPSEKEYKKAINKYSIFSWLWSFFPFPELSDAYYERITFASELKRWAINLAENEFNDSRFEHKLKRAVLVPSWGKIAIVALLSLLMFAIALTGIGALAELGVLGSFFTFGVLVAIGKLTISTFASLAAFFSTSTLNFAIITTAISGFLATGFFQELRSPGRFLHDMFFSVEVQNNKASFRNWIVAIPFLSPILEVSYESIFHHDVVSLRKDWFERSINFLLNPVKLITGTLNFIELTLDLMIEAGATKGYQSSPAGFIAKSLIHAIFDLIRMPLNLLETIFNIPFLVLKNIIYMTSCGECASDVKPEGLLGGNPEYANDNKQENGYNDSRFQQLGISQPQPQDISNSYPSDPASQHGNVFAKSMGEPVVLNQNVAYKPNTNPVLVN